MIIYTPDEEEDGTSGSGSKKGAPKKEEKASFDWKNQGFSSEERITLKVNVKEANIYDAKKKNNFAGKQNPMQNLPNGLNKIRKKIRDVYDEEEDEDEWGVVIARAPEEYDNSLMKALDENEKKIYDQQQSMKNVQMQQTAGKMEAMAVANRMAQQIGMAGVSKKEINIEMNKAEFNPEMAQKKVIKKDIFKEKGIKGDAEIKNIKDVIQTARGIKRVEEIGGKESTGGLEAKDIKEAGKEKKSNKDVAEIIIEKRGLKKEDAAQIRENAAKHKEKSFDKGRTKQDKQNERVEHKDRQHIKQHSRGQRERV